MSHNVSITFKSEAEEIKSRHQMKLVANARVRFSIVSYLKSFCKHGDEESEDYYENGLVLSNGLDWTAGDDFGRNKSWNIELIRDQG